MPDSLGGYSWQTEFLRRPVWAATGAYRGQRRRLGRCTPHRQADLADHASRCRISGERLCSTPSQDPPTQARSSVEGIRQRRNGCSSCHGSGPCQPNTAIAYVVDFRGCRVNYLTKRGLFLFIPLQVNLLRTDSIMWRPTVISAGRPVPAPSLLQSAPLRG